MTFRTRSTQRHLASALLCALWAISAPAAAQDGWTEALAAEERLATAVTRADSLDPATTTGDRAQRDVVTAARAYREHVRPLLFNATLDDEIHAQLLDGYLTAVELEGAAWLAVGECKRAWSMLGRLLQHPDIAARPLLAQTTTERAADAQRCVEAAMDARVQSVTEVADVTEQAMAGVSETDPIVAHVEQSYPERPGAGGLLWTSASVTAAATITAVTLGVRAERAEDVARVELMTGDDYERYSEQSERATRSSRGANAAIGIAAVSGAVTVVAALLHTRRSRTTSGEARGAHAPVVGFGHSGIGLAW